MRILHAKMYLNGIIENNKDNPVIQNVIGYIKDYSLAAQLCREAGIGYKKIKALQKDCGYSYKEEVNDFLKESRNGGTELKLEK